MATIAALENRTLGEQLTGLANRLNGAMDFWTINYLTPIVPSFVGFIDYHAHRFHMAISALPSDGESATVTRRIEEMHALVDRLAEVYRGLPAATEIDQPAADAAAREIRTVRAAILAHLQALAIEWDCTPASWQGREPGWSEYFQRIDDYLHLTLTTRLRESAPTVSTV